MQRRFWPLIVGLLTLTFAGGAGAQPPSPAGRWRTYDDKTGEAKSIVVITESNGVLSGQIEKVFSPPAPNDNPTCKACTGELNEKPVIGMRIMWDMKKGGSEYSGGRLMDPENGKTYRGKVRLIEGGKKLEVRGFIGFSLLGRTQTWVREP
jgi:uncharacterized protein (DUF2147 family)